MVKKCIIWQFWQGPNFAHPFTRHCDLSTSIFGTCTVFQSCTIGQPYSTIGIDSLSYHSLWLFVDGKQPSTPGVLLMVWVRYHFFKSHQAFFSNLQLTRLRLSPASLRRTLGSPSIQLPLVKWQPMEALLTHHIYVCGLESGIFVITFQAYISYDKSWLPVR